MSDSIFQEGGPLNVERTGSDAYRMSIHLYPDEQGMIARACTDGQCSPGYFKVKPGTGITQGQKVAYCPYCRIEAEPDAFSTKAQRDYAIALAENEAIKGVDSMMREALGLGQSNTKTLDAGLISIKMSYEPAKSMPVSSPIEEELRRNLICPQCGLEHAVFGLATWCPDCGKDIFTFHIRAEIDVIKTMLSDIDRRRSLLGARVAGRDVENALEDLVSVFEAVLKKTTHRHMLVKGLSRDQVAEAFGKKVRNRYQNIETAASTFEECVGINLFELVGDKDVSFLRTMFETRHPITHNLGVVDRKYLDHVWSVEAEGSEVRLTPSEVEKACGIVLSVLTSAYTRVFPADCRPA